MTHEALAEILTSHRKWLNDEEGGKRADLSDAKNLPSVPVVADLDRKILDAIGDEPSRFNMSAWHTCDTTHCRAGWAITLAGEQGKALESAYGPSVAGALLYAAAYPSERIPDFVCSNGQALADMHRRAGLQPTETHT